MSSYQYRKSHCGDKTVVRSSYLHNGISYTGKMSSLYWIGALRWCMCETVGMVVAKQISFFQYYFLSNYYKHRLSFIIIFKFNIRYPHSPHLQRHLAGMDMMWCNGKLTSDESQMPLTDGEIKDLFQFRRQWVAFVIHRKFLSEALIIPNRWFASVFIRRN